MRRGRAVVVTLLLVLVADLGVGGCVSLPQRGPVRSVSVQDNSDGETLVDYTPAGPRRGMAPGPLVDNFLTSMTATPLNTYVAREFLTRDGSRTWVPERGTVIYSSQELVVRPGGRVTVRLGGVVELDGRGTWRGDPTHGRGHDYRLRLVKEHGQWRISRPPDRLLIPRGHFVAQYQQYLLSFLDKSAQVLVPEPVYVPRGRQAPTLLVAALLKGPEPDLDGSERTFFPARTTLDGISVPVSRDGTAEVPLSDEVLDVGDHGLKLLFAQLASTLSQVPGIRRMRVTVGGTPLDLPASREDVGVGDWTDFDPSVAWASTSMFGLRDRRVVTLTSGGEDRVSGPFGTLRLPLRSLAVDLLAQHVAGVSADGRRVLVSDRDGVPGRPATRADVRSVYEGSDVLEPAYDVYGQLWVVDRTAVGARLSVVRAGRARVVDAPGITGEDVARFVLSRDGTRLVALVRRGDRDVVQVARVARDEKGRVLGVSAPRRLDLRGTTGRAVDIAWRSPATVAVLTRPSADSSQMRVVNVDGSPGETALTTDPEAFRGRGTRLVMSPAPGTPALLMSSQDQLFRLTRSERWQRTGIKTGLQAPTFVG